MWGAQGGTAVPCAPCGPPTKELPRVQPHSPLLSAPRPRECFGVSRGLVIYFLISVNVYATLCQNGEAQVRQFLAGEPKGWWV